VVEVPFVDRMFPREIQHKKKKKRKKKEEKKAADNQDYSVTTKYVEY
jgi:hypothetical protein